MFFLNGFSQHKSNVYSLQGANILLTDNGDVKLGKFLFSILILKNLNSSTAFSCMCIT